MSRLKKFTVFVLFGILNRLRVLLARIRRFIFGIQISDVDFKRSVAGSIGRTRRELPKFFFTSTERNQSIQFLKKEFPRDCKKVLEFADQCLGHKFDLLGSGLKTLGDSMPWRTDFKVNYTWPKIYWRDINYWDLNKTIPYDIKVPWELSRFQWLPMLGEAYWLTGDEKYAREFKGLIADWIKENPSETGPNWCVSMEVAIRAINWLTAYYFFCESKEIEDDFWKLFFRSLLAHGRHLANNLESSEAPGNHYVSDGAGLIFLGLLAPELKESPLWLATGKKIILSELDRQILVDGVDYEMSTSYHRLMFELFYYSLLLMRFNGEQIADRYFEKIEQMAEFVTAYTRPDGLVSQVGDNDNGRLIIFGPASWGSADDHRYLASLAAVQFKRSDLKAAVGNFGWENFWILGGAGYKDFQALPGGVVSSDQAFPAGGFYSWHDQEEYILIRFGGVGRLGFGGHSHNDVGSFEYFNREPIIVDPGTGSYTALPELRNQLRGTAAHNTLFLDHEEMRPLANDALFTLRSEYIPRVTLWEANKKGAQLAGINLEYTRLGVTHKREFSVSHNQLSITDWLEGAGQHQVDLNFNFAPGIKVKIARGVAELRGDNWRGILSVKDKNDRIVPISLTEGIYSAGYGQAVPTIRLTASQKLILPDKLVTGVETL